MCLGGSWDRFRHLGDHQELRWPWAMGPWGHAEECSTDRFQAKGWHLDHRDLMFSQGASVVRRCKSLFSGVSPCVNGQHNYLQSFPNSLGEQHPGRENVGSFGQLCNIAGALYWWFCFCSASSLAPCLTFRLHMLPASGTFQPLRGNPVVLVPSSLPKKVTRCSGWCLRMLTITSTRSWSASMFFSNQVITWWCLGGWRWEKWF